MNPFFETLTTIGLAIVTLGIVSVVVSKKAQTPQVIQAAGSAFGNSLAVAESPVTGATYQVNLSYPSSSGTDFSGSFGYG
jgi:PRD1 phage membrane DNA delivery